MFRKKIRTASSTLPALPSFPNSEQIEADLDAASGHDVIFVTQVPDNLTETQFHLRFQNQQLDTAGSDNDVEVVDLPLYDKTYFAHYWGGLIGRDDLVPSVQLVHNPWLYSVICSSLVGLSGLFPVFLLSLGKTNENRLRFMLSFACGGLLGDVFLHLLPEAYERVRHAEDIHTAHTLTGLWILAGILVFTVIEMLCKDDESSRESGIKVEGYLNLAANCIDNFAHGLAVGGAFLVDNKTGFITTACILMHEIPHEIGDFAILMKSGFSKMEAAKAQMTTASLGIMGALVALFLDSYLAIDAYTFWIIPFTSGGFLHIALVGVLPDLMKSSSVVDSVIAHNLNLERLKSLKTRLSNALETLDKETPQIEEGTETLQKLLSDTKDKFEDVKSLKTFSRPRQ
ncbi:hypothetical protein TCAL_00137 [Tigriopus californicus]|uniref:Uncharacterized protein n=1 Tax=Tigriopus californicus TaxID=6832 RepID=A0A553PFV9_TIGCA|nr:hypothetical protein TCAL_00137 [Tigriopus californicus]